MKRYAKIVDGRLSYAVESDFPGVPNPLTNDPALRRSGYLPVVGEAEEREGFVARPSSWHVVEQSYVRTEPRNQDPVTGEPFTEDVMEEDPETNEMKKVDEKVVFRDVTVTFDGSYVQIDGWEYEPIPVPPEPQPTLDDYNAALEARLLEVRTERGYTDREPDSYALSTVPRWAQDARDWVAYRDSVMVFALGVLNDYQRTGEPPMTIGEFRQELAGMECGWTYADGAGEGSEDAAEDQADGADEDQAYEAGGAEGPSPADGGEGAEEEEQ